VISVFILQQARYFEYRSVKEPFLLVLILLAGQLHGNKGIPQEIMEDKRKVQKRPLDPSVRYISTFFVVNFHGTGFS